MKLRINNDKSQAIKVVLEPWASEYQLMPGDYMDYVSEGNAPDGAYFQVNDSEYGIILYPEWEKALVYAYNSKGEVIG